jgi:hydrogenase-4 component E
MTAQVNFLVGLSMGLNLIALASGRLPALIRTVALQGIALGLVPLMLEWDHPDPLIVLLSVATVAGKGFVIPFLLGRAMRAAQIEREDDPILGPVPSILLGAAGTVLAVVLAGMMPLLPGHADLLLVPGGMASLLAGFLLLVGRAKAISQVCGYLVMENGIYLFGMLLLKATPLLVEAGVLLDLTVAVFVLGIVIDRIQRAFDSLDTRQLTALRE